PGANYSSPGSARAGRPRDRHRDVRRDDGSQEGCDDLRDRPVPRRLAGRGWQVADVALHPQRIQARMIAPWRRSLVRSLDSFVTARLRAERLQPEHFDAIRAMDTDAQFMTHLGGIREAAQTAAYMSRNLQHWDDYGFGLWVVSDAEVKDAGHAVHGLLYVEGFEEVEFGVSI